MTMRWSLTALLLAAVTMCAAMCATTTTRAEDAESLNRRVCANSGLSEHERGRCEKEMQSARTDDDRAKVRKEYEQKILDNRARKSGSSE
jgi:hypothetical protein